MIKLQEIERELIEDLRDVAEQFKYMSSYARTKETIEIMNELKQALVETTDNVLEYNLIEFNNNWQELKYALVDLENAIHEERKANKRDRKSPHLNKLDDLLGDVIRYEVWSIDRMTSQPVVY